MPVAGLSATNHLLVTAWKAELAMGRAALRRAYEQRANPGWLLRRHASLVDRVIRTVWRKTQLPASAALVAVGGYGRKQLFPRSDIDLLVLTPDDLPSTFPGRIEMLVGALWDIGLEIGHSVRTIGECLQQSADDVTVQTNLLEARLLCGSRLLFDKFSAAFSAALDPRAFYTAKTLEQEHRHARLADIASRLEPNVKESVGGLRDLHNILWIARAAGLGTGWPDLVARGLITAEEASQLARQERALADLRIRLHYLAGRREDKLLFDQQTALAAQLGVEARGSRRPSEVLMQRFYRTAKTVFQLNAMLLQNFRVLLFPRPEASPQVLNERFQIRHELLQARGEDLFQREPAALLECFALLQQHPEIKGIEAETLRALWRERPRIDGAFRKDPRNQAVFMGILRGDRWVVRALRLMNQYGILGRYLPAFRRIVGQMQFDLFHVYTVDEHILNVVRNLRRFAVPNFAHEYPLCSRLMDDFARPEALYLAGLFHDIAKGRGGDHSELGARDARRFCLRHGLGREDTDLVAWLVRHHLLMSATAQKKDIFDPDVIRGFAARMGNERRLVALYLLTVADVRGTSPKVWNAWKAKLLEDLFFLTRNQLRGVTLNAEDSLQIRQKEALNRLRLYGIGPGAQQRLWDQLDTGYFLRHSAEEIAWHTRQLYYRPQSERPVVRARLSPAGEGLQVLVYTPDQAGLFARICGFFERINYNIMEAKVYTTRSGYALDTLQAMEASGHASYHYRDFISFVEHELAETLQRKAPLEPIAAGRMTRQVKHYPITPEVNIVPDEKGLYHVLSVLAGDRPGLLSRVARTLLAHGISIEMAKINTLGERAEDTFLVRGGDLENPKDLVRLEQELIVELR